MLISQVEGHRFARTRTTQPQQRAVGCRKGRFATRHGRQGEFPFGPVCHHHHMEVEVSPRGQHRREAGLYARMLSSGRDNNV